MAFVTYIGHQKRIEIDDPLLGTVLCSRDQSVTVSNSIAPGLIAGGAFIAADEETAALVPAAQEYFETVSAVRGSQAEGDVLTFKSGRPEWLPPSPSGGGVAAQVGPLFIATGDSRDNPSVLHTKDMQDRWTTRLAREIHAQLRNLGVGGSSILGESGDQPLPRILAYLMGVDGPGYDYTLASTSRQPPPALITLFDAYNTLWKWDFTANPAFWDTADNCYETFCRLARSDYFFPVGSGIAAPHWTFPAGWTASVLNTNYGVGPTNRLAAAGDGAFTFNPSALGGGSWPGGDLVVIVRARKDVDNSPNWRCRIRARIGTGPYIVTYDSTGGTPDTPALGVDGGAALTSLVIPIPAGTSDLVTFDVDSIEGQCTIMGAALEVGDKADWPSPVVTLAQQPQILASPDGTHPQITNDVVGQLNDLLADVASRFTDGRVAVVNLPAVINGQAPGGAKWFKDNVHHSNLGNAVIAEEHARLIGQLGLSPSHSCADLTCAGAPTWVSFPGDAVWDRVAHHWWICLDDPGLATGNDNRKVWVPADSPVPVEIADTDYELAPSDMGGLLLSTAPTEQAITLAAGVGIQPGTRTIVVQGNAAVVFVPGPGATVESRGDFRTINGLHGRVTVHCLEADRYLLEGDLIDATGEVPVYTTDEVQAFGDGRWRRRTPSGVTVPPVAAKLGLLLLQTAKGNLVNTLTPIGVRIEPERDGELRSIGFVVGNSAGNIEILVYDTGDAQGGAIGTRTKLWASGSLPMAGTPGITAGQWSTVDPGAGTIPVTAGKHLDVLIACSDILATFARASVPGNSLQLPSAYMPVPGGALPKLGFKYPAVADLAAATAPATVAAASVVGQDVVPYLAAYVA